MIQKKLAEYIEVMGFKLNTISSACGIEYSALSRSMSGNRRLTLDEFAAICDFIGVRMDYFYGENHGN